MNFQEICKMMRRGPEHVFQFMMAELGTEGSIDGNQRLVIRGKFVPKVRDDCFNILHSLINYFFNILFIVYRIAVKEIHNRICFLSNVQKLLHHINQRQRFQIVLCPLPRLWLLKIRGSHQSWISCADSS